MAPGIVEVDRPGALMVHGAETRDPIPAVIDQIEGLDAIEKREEARAVHEERD